jgi:hypothetical protein
MVLIQATAAPCARLPAAASPPAPRWRKPPPTPRRRHTPPPPPGTSAAEKDFTPVIYRRIVAVFGAPACVCTRGLRGYEDCVVLPRTRHTRHHGNVCAARSLAVDQVVTTAGKVYSHQTSKGSPPGEGAPAARGGRRGRRAAPPSPSASRGNSRRRHSRLQRGLGGGKAQQLGALGCTYTRPQRQPEVDEKENAQLTGEMQGRVTQLV